MKGFLRKTRIILLRRTIRLYFVRLFKTFKVLATNDRMTMRNRDFGSFLNESERTP